MAAVGIDWVAFYVGHLVAFGIDACGADVDEVLELAFEQVGEGFGVGEFAAVVVKDGVEGFALQRGLVRAALRASGLVRSHTIVSTFSTGGS